MLHYVLHKLNIAYGITNKEIYLCRTSYNVHCNFTSAQAECVTMYTAGVTTYGLSEEQLSLHLRQLPSTLIAISTRLDLNRTAVKLIYSALEVILYIYVIVLKCRS